MVTIAPGLPPALLDQATEIYWQAFAGKLGPVLGPTPRAQAFLRRVMRPDHCLAVVQDGQVLGIAGFKSPEGAFVGGSFADLRAVYGLAGAVWRALALWSLSHEVDNRRFLIDGIAVAAPAQGRGLGSALLDALCAEATARGYTTIRLEVIDTNPRARALYERHGFVAIRTDRMGPLRLLFGFSAATTMVKDLP